MILVKHRAFLKSELTNVSLKVYSELGPTKSERQKVYLMKSKSQTLTTRMLNI